LAAETISKFSIKKSKHKFKRSIEGHISKGFAKTSSQVLFLIPNVHGLNLEPHLSKKSFGT
jgi:hypothetical protein